MDVDQGKDKGLVLGKGLGPVRLAPGKGPGTAQGRASPVVEMRQRMATPNLDNPHQPSHFQVGHLAVQNNSIPGVEPAPKARPRPGLNRWSLPPPPAPTATYHSVPNPPDAEFIQFPYGTEPDDQFRAHFKALVQYWDPTPEQIARAWHDFTHYSPLDALQERYDFGLDRHNPEGCMHFEQPPPPPPQFSQLGRV